MLQVLEEVVPGDVGTPVGLDIPPKRGMGSKEVRDQTSKEGISKLSTVSSQRVSMGFDLSLKCPPTLQSPTLKLKLKRKFEVWQSRDTEAT